MNIHHKLLFIACILSSFRLHAATESAIINFKTLVDEMCAIIPENANRRGSAAQEEIATIVKDTLTDEMYTFLNAAYQADALRPLIEEAHDDIKTKIDHAANTTSKDWTTYLFDGLTTQTVGYLALKRALTMHENVILQCTAPWCPPCQFFEPVLERCAQEYAPTVRIIKVDITQYKILGIPIESIPTYIFFKKGKEVYRQTGLNLDAVAKKFIDPNSPECKAATLKFLEDDLRLTIGQYLLS